MPTALSDGKFVSHDRHGGGHIEPLRELQVWMLENLREDLTVEKLAERIGMSP